MTVPHEVKWRIWVWKNDRQAHSFTTDEKERLSDTLETIAHILETEALLDKKPSKYKIELYPKET